MTLERPPAPAPASHESSRRAWLAVLSVPLVTFAALVLGFGGVGDPALLLIPVPIVIGFALGFRSARTGNRSGALAAATAIAEAMFLVMIWIGANVIEFKSDGSSLLLGIVTAVLAFAVVAVVLHGAGSGRLAALLSRPSRRSWRLVAVVAVVALVAGLAAVSVSLWQSRGGSMPSFPSLIAQPDPSLRGSVAYYANDSGCIRLVAASGQQSKTLWCLPKEDTSSWPTAGKPAGPQLVWRADGRLEVTIFRFRPERGKTLNQSLSAGWQKLIDVRTGTVEDVPAAQVPSTPNTGTEPTVTPTGARLSYSLNGSSGRAKVTLTDETGTRTLLSVHGPGEYTYRFGPVFWAPNWQWVAASDDGRILVITLGKPAVTRVLVSDGGGGAGGGTAGPAFAVTGADVFASTK